MKLAPLIATLTALAFAAGAAGASPRLFVYASPGGLAVIRPGGSEVARVRTGVADAGFASWAR